ncbi:MAG: class I SAM-dependent methyltransferase [Acidobacteriia bacterium]|nr:class I SAM-dependent methyltransferase [Terriglobia bacterium]
MNVCPMCRSANAKLWFRQTDRLYRTTDRQFAVVRCAACGLARLDPQPAPDELRRYYPESYWFAPDAGPAGRLEEAYRRLVLRDHVRFVVGPPSARRGQAPASSGRPEGGPALLDVGAGGGLFLGMMRERGFRVAALDLSAKAAALAWSRQQVPAVCGLLDNPPLRPGAFAVITMFHVLEHLADPAAYLRSARGLLAPGGRLVVQVPNAASWQARLLGRRWNGADVPRHLVDFRAGDIHKLLETCGFQVVRRKYFSLRDNPAGLASSLAPGLDPMARRVRHVAEGGIARLVKDLAYFALVVAALPFAWVEAAFAAGSTVMIEARRP